MQEKGLAAEQVEGVGVGVPGPVLDSRIVPIICANLGGWGKHNVAEELGDMLGGIKVLVGNDATWPLWARSGWVPPRAVAARSWSRWAPAWAVVSSSTARSLMAPTVRRRDRPHHRGPPRDRCLRLRQARMSGAVFQRHRRCALHEEAAGPSNPDTPCTLRGTEFAAKDVFDAARNGDALAAREVDEMTDTLGMALATIAATVDPEMFMVGGGVSRAGEVLFAPLREHFKVYAFKSCRETPIVPAILGNDAGIYGSVRLIVGE